MESIEGGIALALLVAAAALWPGGSPQVEEPSCAADALREIRARDRAPRLACAGACPGCPPPSGASGLLLGRPIDVNAASVEDLRALPRVGPKLAGRIVRDREARGPFASPEDLARVTGIGPGRVRALRGWLVAGGPRARYNGPSAEPPDGVQRADPLREVRDPLQPR